MPNLSKYKKLQKENTRRNRNRLTAPSVSCCSISLIFIVCLLALPGCASNSVSFDDSSSARAARSAYSERGYAYSRLNRSATAAQGPSHSVLEKADIPYTLGSMAFPSGSFESAAIVLEKIVPSEAIVNTQFTYEYTLQNVTDYPVANVRLCEEISDNFEFENASPAPSQIDGNKVYWDIGYLDPGQRRKVSVTGLSPAEGQFKTNGLVTFNPVLPELVRIVRGELDLIKSSPEKSLICDTIPLSYHVTNTGTSLLTGVTVQDQLPDGLRALDGQSVITHFIGKLLPGESKSITSETKAERGGSFSSSAVVTSDQNIKAQASAKSLVVAPAISVKCDGPDDRFLGRDIEVNYTITNNGDAPAENVIVQGLVPANVVYHHADSNGALRGKSVVWNLSRLESGSSKRMRATFIGERAGAATFAAVAYADCSPSASAVFSTEISGIPALLLEVFDLEDPVEVDGAVSYRIVVSNQGSAPDSDIHINCLLEDSQEFISASGSTPVSVSSANTVEFAPVNELSPAEQASWEVKVQAKEATGARFSVRMVSDRLQREVIDTEATNQY